MIESKRFLQNCLEVFVTLVLLVFICPRLVSGKEPMPWQRGTYDPDWAQAEPLRVKRIVYAKNESERANGSILVQAFKELRSGDRLEIGPGRYVVTSKVTLDLSGTARTPIWIVAKDPKHPPVIMQPDAQQNLLNIGERDPCRYLVLRHLELTGGSIVIRFYDCANVWLDRCELHHAEGGGITVNSRDTHRMYITRNHIHDFDVGTGEGMYLGSHDGKVVMRDSIIAANHVHHCGGEQGDGIELKQGSYNNWIVANHIHDTQYPCLIAYGTAGKGINVIERNLCYRSDDNAIQVQGEAIVRNNLIMAAGGAGIASMDHQGKSHSLVIMHNTVITTGHGVNLTSWNGREGMVFGNNAVYSRDGQAIRFPRGSAGVTIAGNVVVGAVHGADHGYVKGRSLEDFKSVSWDGSRRDALPASGSVLIDNAEPKYVLPRDLRGKMRAGKAVVGAFTMP